MTRNGMEKRGGAWTSQTFSGDAASIRRLADEIAQMSGNQAVIEKAQRIASLARGLEHDLR